MFARLGLSFHRRGHLPKLASQIEEASLSLSLMGSYIPHPDFPGRRASKVNQGFLGETSPRAPFGQAVQTYSIMLKRGNDNFRQRVILTVRLC